MPRRKKQHVHLKKAAEKKKQRSNGVAFKKPPGYAAVVQNAIRATPVAIPRMCKLLRLEATRSILLWVGCGCGEEIFAILRRVGNIYVVALEQNEHDLGTFRSTLVAAKGVHRCIQSTPRPTCSGCRVTAPRCVSCMGMRAC